MRIAVLILGLILGAALFLQSLLGNMVSNAADNQEAVSATSAGVFLAAAWLVASAIVIPLPRVAMILFFLGALWGAGFTADFPDLAFWAGVSVFLGILSFFGWRGKRRADIKERTRDDWMRQMAANQQGGPPPAP